MVEKIGLFIFLVSTLIYGVCCMSSKSMQCVDALQYMSSYCENGCCGNRTINGWGTMPCCEREQTPQYIYLLLAIGLLIPCAICLMILRRAGERCRRPVLRRPSRRTENLQGTMPSFGDRRLMVATIADLLYNSRQRRESAAADIVFPPSYDDAVKESYDELKPPEYSEVLKMDPTAALPLENENDSPPEYTQSDHPGFSNENTIDILSDIPSTSTAQLLVLNCNPVSSGMLSATENRNSYDNNGFSLENTDATTQQRHDTSS